MVVGIILLAAAGGCTQHTRLISTPTVSVGAPGVAQFGRLPADQRTTRMEILYAADRSVVHKTLLGVEYGSGRSGQLAVGRATVDFHPPMSWDQLVALSTSEEHQGPRPTMQLKSAVEFGIIAVPLSRMTVRDGQYVLTPDARDDIEDGVAELHAALREKLAQSKRKDVFVFVHGFNNSFTDAIFRLAMVWHMAGRPGVPIAYTWPAGRGGITGYAYDRESGEFTVYHMRRFLRALASCPEVERIHIIAHSRGTDIVCTALRELSMETRAKGQRMTEAFRIGNLVLAAPDLDAEVFEQRFAIEDLHLAAQHTTVYLSKTDLALAVSRWLFGGGNRLGNLRPDDFSEDAREKLSQLKAFTLINCNVTGYSSSHDYAFTHPAVVSDLILLLRDGRLPGAQNGRPMRVPFEGVWEIDNDYLRGPDGEPRIPPAVPLPPPASRPIFSPATTAPLGK